MLFCPLDELKLYLIVQQSQVYKELTMVQQLARGTALLEALLSCSWGLLPTCGV